MKKFLSLVLSGCFFGQKKRLDESIYRSDGSGIVLRY